MVIAEQLTLGVRLKDDLTLSDFYPGPNQALVAAIRTYLGTANEPLIYLWGGAGSGRSHLLQAICHEAGMRGKSVAYLPIQTFAEYSPTVLEGSEAYDIVCVDDVDAIAGNEAWEEAVFHFFNRLRDSGTCLFVTAQMPPRMLPIMLADLKSRMNWGVTFQLQQLSDEDKVKAMQLKGRLRGFELSDEVAHFIMSRSARDMHQLFSVLDSLDDASLASKRRITVPFVKEAMGW